MNQNMVKFGQVRESVAKQAEKFHDEVVALADVSFESLADVRIGNESFRMRTMAGQGMAARLRVPYQYLSRCDADLQAHNLNYWVEKQKAKSSELLLRFDGNAVRAVLSRKYVPIDNMQVVDEMASLGIQDDADVQCYVDDRFMMLNVPSPEKKFALLKKDEMMPGVSVSNSEVGLASFSVAAFMLRLICTNGMISKHHIEKSSYRHTSHKVLQQLPNILEDATSSLDLLQHSMKEALKVKIEEPEERLIELNDRHLLGESQRKAVTWAWPQEKGGTMFNIIQTYTRASQFETLSVQERYQLQVLGSEVLYSAN
jgi:hypothetical protein